MNNDSCLIYEGDNIYAFKPQPDRYLCFFFTGKKIIVTNAFQKKSDKLPPNEKATAIKKMVSYEDAIAANKKNRKTNY